MKRPLSSEEFFFNSIKHLLKEPIRKAFRIPTIHQKSVFHYNRIIKFSNLKYAHSHLDFKGFEVYEAFNLPIIKGNPFVKVNAN